MTAPAPTSQPNNDVKVAPDATNRPDVFSEGKGTAEQAKAAGDADGNGTTNLSDVAKAQAQTKAPAPTASVGNNQGGVQDPVGGAAPGIVPTVGRKVYYYENAQQAEPYDATIVRVFHVEGADDTVDSRVNVFVTDPGGVQRLVPEVQVGNELTNVPHYRWMPYQLKTAS